MLFEYYNSSGFPDGSVVKNPSSNAGVAGHVGSVSGSGRSPGGVAWQPTPVFWPGEFHGQRSLASYMGSQRVRHDGGSKHKHIITLTVLFLYYAYILLR